MPLAGRAVMVNWSDVAEADRPAYYDWHNREHIAGVVRLPGVRRGRRHVAIEADRDFFNIYEADNLDVFTGRAYRAKVNDPSALTRSTTKVIVRSFRALAHVRLSLGPAQGGFVLTLRFDLGDATLARHLADVALPAIVETPEVVGAHYFVADMPASTYVSAERRDRPTEVPGWIVMVEGVSVAGIQAAADRHLSEAALIGHGAIGPFARGTYQQQISISKLPLWDQ